MPTDVVLQTWKEISKYAGRTERTLQRWERQFGFPVHRPSGTSRSAVMALPREIEEWTRGSPSLVLTRRHARIRRVLPIRRDAHNSRNHDSIAHLGDPGSRSGHQFVRGKMLADVAVERLQLSGVLWEKQKTLQEQITILLREQRTLCEKITQNRQCL